MTQPAATPPEYETAPIQELPREALDHLNLGHWPVPAAASADQYLSAAARDGSLPYSLLDPTAFERLCFHLLLARTDGSVRFWGRRGQFQHGIDLLLSNGQVSTVYQCKHVAAFTAVDLRIALDKFQADWLCRPELGHPERFVLCTSARITDTIAWETLKRDRAADLGVAVEEWHRDALDHWLRSQPGIVAELFGGRVAEAFCGHLAGAGQDLYRPIQPGNDPQVDLCIQLRDRGHLIWADDELPKWRQMLERHGALMIGGKAGTGKTTAALALANEMQNNGWRGFYLRADASQDVDLLVTGLKARCFRPTVVVIDDCHKAPDLVERLLYRVGRPDENLRLVLASRTAPDDAEPLASAVTDLLDALHYSGQVVKLTVDQKRVFAVMRARNAAWRDAASATLLAWSGADLAVLAMMLDAVSPADLKKSDKPISQFPAILRLLFGGVTASAPQLRQLAAIAQFDTDVPAALFPEPLETERNARVVERLVMVRGRPRSLGFYHPSSAELLHSLLCWADGEHDWLAVAASDCIVVLKRAIRQCKPEVWCDTLLLNLLRTELRMSPHGDLKIRVLNDQEVIDAVCGLQLKPSPARLRVLSYCAMYCRGTPAAARFASALSTMVVAEVENIDSTHRIQYFGIALLNIRLISPKALLETESKVGTAAMAQAITRRGSLLELLRILRNCSSDFAERLLRELLPDARAILVERTLTFEVKSIRRLVIPLRDLGSVPIQSKPGQTLLTQFEEWLGAQALARLIAQRGSLLELLRILQNSSHEFSARILQDFPSSAMDSLVERTLALEDESIGTVSLCLQALGERPTLSGSPLTQLQLFEHRLRPGTFWRWMRAIGNLHHMAYVLAAMTPEFRALAFDAEHLPNPCEWEALAMRGSIYSLAKFAAESLPSLPRNVHIVIDELAAKLAQTLVDRANWGSIGSTSFYINRLADDDPLRSRLTRAVQHRVNNVQLYSLSGLDYLDACDLLQVLWQAREDLHPDIGKRLWTLLPSEATWPEDYQLLYKGRFALEVARSPWVNDVDAIRALSAFAPLSDRVTIDAKAARYHAGFLWNLYALWFERGRKWAHSFEAIQSAATWQRFANIVRIRKAWKQEQQKLDTLMLAGALATLVPALRNDLLMSLRGQLRGVRFLLDALDERDLPFVPLWLTCRGLALLMPRSAVFTATRIDSLLEKAAYYPGNGSALRHAVYSIQTNAAGHQGRRRP